MAKLGNSWNSGRLARIAACVALAWLLLAVAPVLASAAESQEPPLGDSDKGFVMQVIDNLFNMKELMRILGRPEYAIAAFLILNLIVFVETGLLIGFFLPGDSLLVTAGIVCSQAEWSLPLLLLTLSLSAIIGDSVGYAIGLNTGPKIFCREKSLFFHRDHLLKAQDFYERHGGKTIVLARFMPIIRTFAPVVAGVGRMRYASFLFFNVMGGIGWVVSMVLVGYFLIRTINPALQPIFGQSFDVQDHIEKVIIIVVLLSISPGLVLWLKSKLKSKTPLVEPELAKASK